MDILSSLPSNTSHYSLLHPAKYISTSLATAPVRLKLKILNPTKCFVDGTGSAQETSDIFMLIPHRERLVAEYAFASNTLAILVKLVTFPASLLPDHWTFQDIKTFMETHVRFIPSVLFSQVVCTSSGSREDLGIWMCGTWATSTGVSLIVRYMYSFAIACLVCCTFEHDQSFCYCYE
jgi:hypothetical protein